MKKFGITLILITIIIVTIAVGVNNSSVNNEYLRIHIRANSNSSIDQNVKYAVKDAVVYYLTPYVAECNSKEEAVKVFESIKGDVESVIDRTLEKNGFEYKSNVKITAEKFPTRVYNDITLEEGYYDAIIVELGNAEGDNWWCVVYPPLCFTNGERGIVYKSKIEEIIRNFFGKGSA